MEIIVDEKGKRIDTYLMEKTDMSRSYVQNLIKKKLIFVNGKEIKQSYLLKEGDVIVINEQAEEPYEITAEDIPLNIVYEDEDIIIVNKENGMVVHPAVGNKSGTLVNALMYHSKNLSDINGEFRPGIVHRIDAYTTGLLMIAKNNKAHEILAKQLEEKTITRKYIALVWGVIEEDTGTIDAPIGRDEKNRKKQAVTSTNSKKAITHFKVLKRYKDASLIELKLETGRTHQIRVHMNYIGHPVVNDAVYGRKKTINDFGQCLHAKTIGFIHPRTNKYMEFCSDLPEEFKDIIKMFEEK